MEILDEKIGNFSGGAPASPNSLVLGLVQLGDMVQIKVWAEFWKGWQDGVVEYVPGISKQKPQHEYNGLKWVAITFRNGQIGPLVDPKSGKLRNVRFVGRGRPNDK